MSNAVEDFLHALTRTLNGDPYSPKTPAKYAPIRYRVAALRDPLRDQVLAGKYRIDSRVGKGAMATVYKAIQEPIDRVVAIKILNHGFTNDQYAVKRFKLEAKTLSALRHRNILSVHDLGNTESGQPFFVMEFLDGISLERLIKNRGPIPVARAVPIFAQICDGLAYAHNEGVIHRDLKPANVMLVREDSSDEIVKLVDFGIVKVSRKSQLLSQQLTRQGEIWGSPIYMSPEQCMGNPLDPRSDIYSLGLLMYESLMGVEAIGGDTLAKIVTAQMTQLPLPFKEAAPALRVPEILERIVFRALQKKPEDRFSSMDELKAALVSFAGPFNIKLRRTTGYQSQNNSPAVPVNFGPGPNLQKMDRLAHSKESTQAPLAKASPANQMPEQGNSTSSQMQGTQQMRGTSPQVQGVSPPIQGFPPQVQATSSPQPKEPSPQMQGSASAQNSGASQAPLLGANPNSTNNSIPPVQTNPPNAQALMGQAAHNNNQSTVYGGDAKTGAYKQLDVKYTSELSTQLHSGTGNYQKPKVDSMLVFLIGLGLAVVLGAVGLQLLAGKDLPKIVHPKNKINTDFKNLKPVSKPNETGASVPLDANSKTDNLDKTDNSGVKTSETTTVGTDGKSNGSDPSVQNVEPVSTTSDTSTGSGDSSEVGIKNGTEKNKLKNDSSESVHPKISKERKPLKKIGGSSPDNEDTTGIKIINAEAHDASGKHRKNWKEDIKSLVDREATKPKHKNRPNRANPAPDSDEAFLENLHLRKHRSDSTQQWLDVQEKTRE